MLKLLMILFILSVFGCADKNTKKSKYVELPPTYNSNSNSLPSFDELNEKHFYQIEVIPNATNLNSKFYCITKPGFIPIYGAGYKIYFDPKQVIIFCDSLIELLNKKNLDSEENYKINSFQKLRKKAIVSFKYAVKFDENYLLDLLPNCQSNFWDTKTQTPPTALLKKTYKTMCTVKGIDFDLITAKGDTVKLINNLEMCMN
ncbi:MAG: hypothetical protein ABL872_09010 [Lacibacter sp.]